MSLLRAFAYSLFAGGVVFVLPALIQRPLHASDHDRLQQLGDSISSFYTTAAMSVIGRAVMVIRANGGQVLKRSSYDAKHNGEKVSLSGSTKKWRNPGGMMHTLANRPFALAFETRDVLFDLRAAYAAEKYHEYRERGEWMVDGLRKAYLNAPRGPTLVDTRAVTNAIQSSASPELPERIDEFVEKMQSEFDSSNAWEYLPWVIASGLGLGLMWFASKLASTTGGSTVGVGI